MIIPFSRRKNGLGSGTPAALAAVAFLALASGCNGQEASQSGAGAKPAVEETAGREAFPDPGRDGSSTPARGYEATTEAAATATLGLTSHLFVERDVSVLTRRAGVVRAVRKNRGDRVAKGEVLCELERKDLELSLELARIEADKARSAFSRAEQLNRELAISAEEIEAARFKLSSAERVRDLAELDLEQSYIRAPFHGVISARNVEVGQVLSENDPRELFRVTAMKPLLARLFVPQWAYPFIHEGDEAALLPVAGSADHLMGRISWVNQVLDAASGSVEILVQVDDIHGGLLRPGMEVQVQLAISVEPGRLTVPRSAVQLDEAGSGSGSVLVTSGAGATRREVRLGFIGDDRVEILSGLEAGERVLERASGQGPGSL